MRPGSANAILLEHQHGIGIEGCVTQVLERATSGSARPIPSAHRRVGAAEQHARSCLAQWSQCIRVRCPVACKKDGHLVPGVECLLAERSGGGGALSTGAADDHQCEVHSRKRTCRLQTGRRGRQRRPHERLIVDELTNRGVGPAQGTGGVAPKPDLAERHRQGVVEEQPSDQRPACTGQQLQGLDRLDGADDPWQGSEHTSLPAGGNEARRRRLLIQAPATVPPR